MKTKNYIKNAFGLYLFEDNNFLNIANKVKFKTSLFALFIINLLFSIIGSSIFKITKGISLLNWFIIVLLSSSIGYLIILFILFIYSGFIHVVYKLFKSNAKFKKLIIMNIAINIVNSILFAVFGGILYYIITHPNLSYHKILISIFLFFNLILLIWYFIVSYIYLGRIERVTKLKSLFAYLIVFLIILGIILLLKLGAIITYLKSIY